jgi:RNA polymerase sigma factor for flagellar operon FliA
MPHLATYKPIKYSQIPPSADKKKSFDETERLISAYAPLVKHIAGGLALRLPRHISQDDLVGAGMMGLLDAIHKFDSEKGVKFKCYAEFRVRGAMIDELRSMDWVPRSVRRNAKRLEEAYAKVEREKMGPARDEEVAEKLGVSIDEFYRLLDETQGISIFEEDEGGNIIAQSDVGSLLQVNNFGNAINPQDSLDLVETKNIIAQTIDRLPTKERTVVTLYYYEELTMKEIAEIMGNTESRVSQLHTKAVIRLRKSLNGYFDQ